MDFLFKSESPEWNEMPQGSGRGEIHQKNNLYLVHNSFNMACRKFDVIQLRHTSDWNLNFIYYVDIFAIFVLLSAIIWKHIYFPFLFFPIYFLFFSFFFVSCHKMVNSVSTNIIHLWGEQTKVSFKRLQTNWVKLYKYSMIITRCNSFGWKTLFCVIEF